jgi:uncharacterized protein YdeI (YjbR/CyaY-like superfamily)
MKPVFFASSKELRAWLQKNHAKETELWVGMYKKHTGKPSVTWPEVVDQVLCFGWIDGIRKSIDEDAYMNRITPRRKGSNWSAINIKRVKELTKLGLMKPAGMKAFEARDPKKANQYSFERESVTLTASQLKQFKANKKAWAFFETQPPSYRKIAAWYVLSAKQAATQQRRLEKLISDSERGERIGPMQPARKNK